jgi:hypothetical protein
MNPFLSFLWFFVHTFVCSSGSLLSCRKKYNLSLVFFFGHSFLLTEWQQNSFFSVILSLLDCQKTNSYRKKCNVEAFEVHCFFFLLNQACVVSSSKREEHRILVVVGLVSVSLVPGRRNAALEHLWVDGQRVVEQCGAFSCALIDVIHFAVMSLYD